jgi:hypothetical protein
VIKPAVCAPGFHTPFSFSDVIFSHPNGQVVSSKKNSFVEIEPGTRVPITRSGKLFYLAPAGAPESHGRRFEAFMHEEVASVIACNRTIDVSFSSLFAPSVDIQAAAIASSAESLVRERFGHLSHAVVHKSRHQINSFNCPAAVVLTPVSQRESHTCRASLQG